MGKKRVKKTKETAKRVDKRSKTGQFMRGTKGGPGRKKGNVKDLLFKDGKKRSTEELIQDLLTTYVKLGSDKMLYKWATESRGNLKRFLDILFKFAPPAKPIDPSDPRNPVYQASERFMPKLTIERVITDQRPNEHGGAKMKMPRPGDMIDKKMKEMEDKLRERDAEIQRLMNIFETHDIDIGEVVHKPIRAIELPESSEGELDEKIEIAEKRREELKAKVKEKENG